MFDPVATLKEFIRHPSISADPQSKEGMRGARPLTMTERMERQRLIFP